MVVCSRMLVSRRFWRVVAVGSAFSVVAVVLPGPGMAVGAAAGVTTLVSVSSAGVQANSDSLARPAISADGRYVAFHTDATNLVPGDTNGEDVFVRDRRTGATSRVSVSSDEAQANGGSAEPAITYDGRYVAFASDAANLAPGDTNGTPDVFLRDRQAGTTRRVSVSGTGAQANGYSGSAAISANGRYVVFYSEATNLVPGDTNNTPDVFLRDRQAGTTRRISVSSTGAQANNLGPEANGSGTPSISADGRYVAFYSFASNLVPGDTNGTDIFLRDWQAGTTRRVSVSSAGAQANNVNAFPAISPDGRYVAWHSYATNLVPGDTNATADIFVRDWQARTTRRASVSSTGAQANSESVFPVIGSGGRYVAFRSTATNLVPGDTNGFTDIFIQVT